MRRRFQAIALIAFTVLGGGCGSWEVAKPKIVNSRLIPAPFEPTWSAVVESVAVGTYTIKTIEKASGILALEPVTLPEVFSDECDRLVVLPDAIGADWQAPVMHVNFFVIPEGENTTRVTINTSVRVYEAYFTERWFTGYSKGVIEKTLLDEIESRIRTRSATVVPKSDSTHSN